MEGGSWVELACCCELHVGSTVDPPGRTSLRARPWLNFSNLTCPISPSVTLFIPKMSARTDAEAEQNQLSSGITPDTLTTKLKEKLDASHVDISDLSGTQFHLIRSFCALTLLQVAVARCSKL